MAWDKDKKQNAQLDINLNINIIPSTAEQSISAKLDLILSSLEKLGVGGASAAEIAAVTQKAQDEVVKAQQLQKTAEDLAKS